MLTRTSHSFARRPVHLWTIGPIVLCLLYGLMLILLIHTPADGSWFWYATALRHQTRLYGDLHLALQPLYAMELAGFQRLLGLGWIYAQAPACLNLALFLTALLLVSRQIPLHPRLRGLLVLCAFVVTMGFIMMRFDDYHVLSASFQLLCAAALLAWLGTERRVHRLLLMACAGLLCGLCMLNRLNDGGLLMASCAAVVAGSCFARTTSAGKMSAWKELLPDLGVLGLTAIAVIKIALGLLHERFADWKLYSITRAAAIKGGTGKVFLYPFRLPWGTLRELLLGGWRWTAVRIYVVLVAAICMYGAQKYVNASSRQERQRLVLGLGLLLAFLSLPFHAHISHGNIGRILVAGTLLAMYVAIVTILLRFVHVVRSPASGIYAPRQLILLLPFGQLLSISMSAARWYPNTYPAAALFLLLLPIGLPEWFAGTKRRAAWFSVIGLLTLSIGVNKIRDPFDWFNYRSRSLDAPRVWIEHPIYGPMLMQKDQVNLMAPVCQKVDRNSQLLSVPFTFANYFCGIPPWHGYIQTFYDTASRQTLEDLVHDLQQQPPEWILYQRQPDVLKENEWAFNSGRPLPHRALDAYVMRQLSTGNWSAVLEKAPFRDTSTWLLIHTGRASQPVTGANAANASPCSGEPMKCKPARL